MELVKGMRLKRQYSKTTVDGRKGIPQSGIYLIQIQVKYVYWFATHPTPNHYSDYPTDEMNNSFYDG